MTMSLYVIKEVTLSDFAKKRKSKTQQQVRKPQPRNQPCTCGSGKKAKKCCIYE